MASTFVHQGVEDVFRRYGCMRIVKLEIVCADHDLNRLVEAIRKMCATGEKGDGMIFVSDVTSVMRIRDSASGVEAL